MSEENNSGSNSSVNESFGWVSHDGESKSSIVRDIGTGPGIVKNDDNSDK